MQFLLLAYMNEEEWQALPENERTARMAEFPPFLSALKSAEAFVTAFRLQPSARGLSVRVAQGKSAVNAGPLTDAREQLSGVYVIEVGSREEAVSWAERLPTARFGAIEVRPLVPPPTTGRP